METATQIDTATAFVISTATPVDCGGGRRAYIKHLTPIKVLAWLGRIPPSFAETVESQMDPVREKMAAKFARENPDFSARWVKCMLAESVVALDFPYVEAGVPMRRCDLARLVDKPQSECVGAEISLSLFDEDMDFVNAVVNAAQILNGWTGEAAESAKPFLRGPGFAWLLRVALLPLRAESVDGGGATAH